MSGARFPDASECGPGGQRFVGDLHLTDEADNPFVPAFCDWLRRQPKDEGLWILGDLFEYWLGTPHLESPGFAPVLAAFAERTAAGGFTAVVPGNRDFLLDASFERATGVVLFPRGARLVRGDSTWLFLHGDELCTEDRGYQRLRSVLRSRPFGLGLKALPAFARRRLARRLRSASRSAVPRKDPAKIAMQPDEARSQVQAAAADHLLCGHAHRYSESALGPGQTWFVLDAFGHGERDMMLLDSEGVPRFTKSGVGSPAPA